MSALEDPMQVTAQRDLELTIDRDGDRGVVRPRGEIDLATVPAVEAAVRDLWENGSAAVVLDLGAVTFFDSSGLRLLIRLQTLAAEHAPRSFALADCSDAVLRVLDLTRLTGRFHHT